ncbi:MAG TPA: hypothetical protein DD381_06195 [Lentisphaeria bacterium]|nr:MAG: hypothetical protein A2X47_05220 [Lentisphaerae bacterium GWF2_38_69]HBM15917.1 hypothetical protein [Lentisphaeria bacterium]
MPYRKFFLYFLFIILSVLPFQSLFATDAEAEESYSNAEKEYNAGDYRDAAKTFAAAELFADSYELKVNAIKAKVLSYKKADMKYQEFLALKQLTEEYPDKVFFRNAIRRQYEIGNAYYEGYREMPWSWVPWLEDEDKCLEIYESIYKQSPFADFIPEMMLKMGTRYIVTKKPDKALDIYKAMITQYKSSPLTRIAYLDASNVYLQMASSGDGDGSKLRGARINLKEYVEKYPDSPEIKWAKNMLKLTYEMEARRLYSLAHYYYKKGNDNAAKRYIQEILVNYPETETARKADELLNYIEMPIYPKEMAPLPEEPTKYTTFSMQGTDARIMVIPENSGNKWLNPLKETGTSEDNLNKEKYINQL